MHQVAARIAEFATGGSILAREETIHRLSDRFFREDLGEQQLKNVREPLHILSSPSNISSPIVFFETLSGKLYPHP